MGEGRWRKILQAALPGIDVDDPGELWGWPRMPVLRELLGSPHRTLKPVVGGDCGRKGAREREQGCGGVPVGSCKPGYKADAGGLWLRLLRCVVEDQDQSRQHRVRCRAAEGHS